MLRAEYMMYDPLAAFFERRGMVVLREVTTPEGRADLIAAHVDWNAARERVESGLRGALLRAPLLRAWEALSPDVPQSLDAWACALDLTKGTVRALARELEAFRFVLQSNDDYLRCESPRPVLTEIICCEAKLDDWRRGLGQAYGHRFYADRSYLALAKPPPKNLDRDLFAQRQVGLLSVENDVAEMFPAAGRQLRPTATRRLIEERFWFEAIEPQLRRRRTPVITATRGATA
jgi:hypothetical protein